ncbi:MAG: bifunctional alpha,alpha-trehalose-phosphate synthase (UDP-forming)/trehalose-phosphatase, partial [Flavipsychrobacter sp.]
MQRYKQTFIHTGTLFYLIIAKGYRMNADAHTGRIINVSNRLPIKINFSEGELTYNNSEGGLATGLSSVLTEYENLWIGWAGADVQSEDMKMQISNELHSKNLHPIFLSQDEINNFYEGFSNETIWPLFHYFPTYSNYSPEYWESYVAVNKKFADEIIKFATPDDIIWVHDYHLMLLPQLLRAAIPNITIGYFQHIPFPSYEIFRALPWKNQILNGLIGADVIGFQTEDDTKHFASSVSRILKLNIQNNEFLSEGRKVNIEAFPISIDYKKYNELSAQETTKKISQKLEKLMNTKIIISIDRLDYSKGILQRLQAFDLFLKQNPAWRQKVTFIHLVVPSRDNARNYKALKREMDRLISEINGKYATLSWQPIRHFYRSFPPNLLSALYKSADLALVTPLIDGMNLVCKEYVASNVHKHGVLILSESAGAARELKEAIQINPNDIEGFAVAISEGLVMPKEERSRRMLKMQQRVQQNDIHKWAQTMLANLNGIKDKRSANKCTIINPSIYHTLDVRYMYAQKRLLFLDYDGTLVPFTRRPEDAFPDTEVLRTLERLGNDIKNNVVVISGRDKATLDKWLGHLPLNIVAEHGA